LSIAFSKLRVHEIAGRRLVLTGYTPELVQFYRSLPEAKWDKLTGVWTCLKTPAALVRILARPELELMNDDLTAEAFDFLGKIQRVKNIQGSNCPAGLVYGRSATKPWNHQRAAFQVGATLGSALEALRMGEGKSKVAVDLCTHWGTRKILVLCPKSVMGVWRREFATHALPPPNVCVLDGTGTVAKKTGIAGTALKREPVAIVINYDSAKREPFAKWALSQEWDLVICDECHRISSHNSIQAKFAAKLGRRARHRLGLSGTPMGQSPLGLFGIFRFLDPGVFGTSWTEFNAHFAKHSNPSIPQMVTGYQNQEELAERMSWYTYRCTDENVLDLPEKTHQDITFTLGAEGMRVYRDLEAEMIAEVKGGTVTAANCMVKLLRLQQVTSGFVQTEGGLPVDVDNEKEAALLELLEGIPADDPVIVFCRFRHDLLRMQAVAKATGRRFGELSGSRRDAINEHAKLSDKVDFAAVQIAAGGLGVDFTRARYCVYYSLSHSLIEFDQSLARLHRPGQKRAVHYYHLVAQGTVDQDVYSAVQKRREVIEEVLAVFGGKQ